MATLNQTERLNIIRIAPANESGKFNGKLMPRRCLVISTGLILAGLSVPVLNAMELLTFTISLGFVSFALVATDGVLTLIFYGEI